MSESHPGYEGIIQNSRPLKICCESDSKSRDSALFLLPLFLDVTLANFTVFAGQEESEILIREGLCKGCEGEWIEDKEA